MCAILTKTDIKDANVIGLDYHRTKKLLTMAKNICK